MSAGLFSINSLAQSISPTTEKELQESVAKHKSLLSSSPLANFNAKNVGPTNMSGRIIDIEVGENPNTFFGGAAEY